VLDALSDAIDELQAFDLDALTDGECNGYITELHGLLARLEATVTRDTVRWDRRGCWGVDGARNGAAWLKWRNHLEGSMIRSMIRLGRQLSDLPVTEQAWLAGEITRSHVRTIASVRTDRTAEAMERDEKMLVDNAKTMFFSHFAHATRYWFHYADPDGSEADARKTFEDRRYDLAATMGGVVWGEHHLDPLNGAAFRNVFDKIYNELFEADWAEAKAIHGDAVSVDKLKRTPAQRRADTLVEMAIRAATAPKDGKRPAPLFSVLVGYETFAGAICELASGVFVTPGSLVSWLDPAYIERVVFDGPGRVIDLGRQRLFVGGLRRVLEVRDRECFHDTCDERDGLEGDHVRPYSKGGRTTQCNGRLGCDFHNRSRDDYDRYGNPYDAGEEPDRDRIPEPPD